MSMPEAMLEAIVSDPRAEDRWLVLSDWLEEYDDPRRGELLRLHRQLLASGREPQRPPQHLAWQTRMVELLEQGVKPMGPRRTIALAQGVEMTFG